MAPDGRAWHGQWQLWLIVWQSCWGVKRMEGGREGVAAAAAVVAVPCRAASLLLRVAVQAWHSVAWAHDGMGAGGGGVPSFGWDVRGTRW